MTQQRITEWINLDERLRQYHVAQWGEPKRSTIAFEAFIKPWLAAGGTVIDLGCGAGAATAYIAGMNPRATFLGIDRADQMVEIARALSQQPTYRNVSFETGDWYDLAPRDHVDGVISLQTLSWLPGFEAPLQAVFERLHPKWIGLSSLFYEGDITCTIEVDEHTRERKSFYNVYSLPAVNRLANRFGYRIAAAVPFEIDIDLSEPQDKNLMGTHTVLIAPEEDNRARRLQISGPLLMPWYFVIMEKIGR